MHSDKKDADAGRGELRSNEMDDQAMLSIGGEHHNVSAPTFSATHLRLSRTIRLAQDGDQRRNLALMLAKQRGWLT